MGKRPQSFSFFILVIIILFITSRASADTLILMTPEKESIVYARSPSTHVVVKASSEQDVETLQLYSSSGMIEPIAVRRNEEGYYIHYQVPLTPRKNKFSFSDKKLPDIVVDYRPLRTLLHPDFDEEGVYLYHRNNPNHEQCLSCHESVSLPRSPFVKDFPCGEKSPTCYTCHKDIFEDVSWQHSPTAGLLCEICHKKDSSSGRVSVTTGQDSDLCYKCHHVKGRAWGDKAYIHQPVGLGVCSICHNPHGDQNRFQLWAEGRGELCVSCHGDKKKLLQTGEETEGETVHGIIRGAGCIVCHEAHASPNPYMLKRPINELCAGCHNDLIGMDRGHPVGGHPLKGPRNPLNPEKEFNCASCHDPHSSKYQYLLVGSVIGGHVCKQCHN